METLNYLNSNIDAAGKEHVDVLRKTLRALSKASVCDQHTACTTNRLGELVTNLERTLWNPEDNSNDTKELYSYIMTDMVCSAQSFGKEDSYLEICSGLVLSSLGKSASGLSHAADSILKDLSKKTGDSYNRSTGSHNTWAQDGKTGSDRSTSVEDLTRAADAILKASIACVGVKPTVVFHGKDLSNQVFTSHEDILRVARHAESEDSRTLISQRNSRLEEGETPEIFDEGEEDDGVQVYLDDSDYESDSSSSDAPVSPETEEPAVRDWWAEQVEASGKGSSAKTLMEVTDKRIKETMGSHHLDWEWFYAYACENGPLRALQRIYPRAADCRLMGSQLSFTDRFAIASRDFYAGRSAGVHPGLLCQRLIDSADIKENWLHYGIVFETSDWRMVVEHGAIKVQRLGSRIISVQSKPLRTGQKLYDTACRAYKSACLTTTFSPETARHYHEHMGELLLKPSTPIGGDYNEASNTMDQVPWGNAPTDSFLTHAPKTALAAIAGTLNQEFAPRLLAIEAVSAFTETTAAIGSKVEWESCRAHMAKILRTESAYLEAAPECEAWYKLMLKMKPKPGHKDLSRLVGPGFKEFVRCHQESCLASENSLLAWCETDKSSFTDVMPAGALFLPLAPMLWNLRSHTEVRTFEEHTAYLCYGFVANQKLMQDPAFAGEDKTNWKGETTWGRASVHGEGCLCCSTEAFKLMYDAETRKRFGMGDTLFTLNRHGVSQGFSAHSGSLYQLFANIGLGYPSIVCFNNDDGLKARRLPDDFWEVARKAGSSPLDNTAATLVNQEEAKVIALCLRMANYASTVYGGIMQSSCSGSVTNKKKTSGGYGGSDPSVSVVYRNIGPRSVVYSHAVGAVAAINTIPYVGIEGLNAHFLEAVVAGVAASGLDMSLADTIGEAWRLLLSIKLIGEADKQWLPWGNTPIFRYITQQELRDTIKRVAKFNVDHEIATRNLSDEEIATIRAYVDAAKAATPCLYTFPKSPAYTMRANEGGVTAPRPDLAGTKWEFDSQYKFWAQFRYKKTPLTMLVWQRKGCHKRKRPQVADLDTTLNTFTIADEGPTVATIRQISARGIPYSAGQTTKITYVPWHGGRQILQEATPPITLIGTKVIANGVETTHAFTLPPETNLASSGGAHKIVCTDINQHTNEKTTATVQVAFISPRDNNQRCWMLVTESEDNRETYIRGTLMKAHGGPFFDCVFESFNDTKWLSKVLVKALSHLGYLIAHARHVTTRALQSEPQTYLMHHVPNFEAHVYETLNKAQEDSAKGKVNPYRTEKYMAELTRPFGLYFSSTEELENELERAAGKSMLTRCFIGNGPDRQLELCGSDVSTVKTRDLGSASFESLCGMSTCLSFTQQEAEVAIACQGLTIPLIGSLAKAIDKGDKGIRAFSTHYSPEKGKQFEGRLAYSVFGGDRKRPGVRAEITFTYEDATKDALVIDATSCTKLGLMHALCYVHFLGRRSDGSAITPAVPKDN